MQRVVWFTFLLTLFNDGIGQKGRISVSPTVLLPNVSFRMRAFFFFLLFICLKLLLNLFVKRKLWWRYFWMQVIGAPLRNVSAGLLKELCRIPAVSPHMKWRVWWIIRSWMLKIIFVVCVQSGWDRKWRSKKWTHSDEIREQTFYWSR